MKKLLALTITLITLTACDGLNLGDQESITLEEIGSVETTLQCRSQEACGDATYCTGGKSGIARQTRNRVLAGWKLHHAGPNNGLNCIFLTWQR